MQFPLFTKLAPFCTTWEQCIDFQEFLFTITKEKEITDREGKLLCSVL